ncbi:helix-turn-helix domain-containing protein [Tateyamaria omphalii]|uniref:arsenate reductase/protein-tyrosine-phosphatase family protein n=1 Tax=Tateyamaria omphalii TaxID=299262 RepID=UPI001C997337|nr:helix-turn-helix domain-containing protein [Tateyamaria omphalii]MBY5931918.1 helix-turn-helix domain-containing protein [Tateyamaria omphalii]
MLIDQLSTLSHPERMRVFRLLMRRCPAAVPAGEVADVLGFKPSTTSVYLSALHKAGLIVQTRQGTSLRYAVDLAGAREMVGQLFLDCCNGRPDLCPPEMIDPSTNVGPMSDQKHNVLFVCTGNSARSIFAEAIMQNEAGDRFNVYSAGTKPSSLLNPFAVDMLQQKGIETSDLRAKNVAEFQGADAPQMDFVFTVCDLAANEECAPWEGQPISAHWGLPDPVKAEGTDAEKRLAFQQTFGAMRNRILAFVNLPLETLSRASLQQEVDEIGRTKDD